MIGSELDAREHEVIQAVRLLQQRHDELHRLLVEVARAPVVDSRDNAALICVSADVVAAIGALAAS